MPVSTPDDRAPVEPDRSPVPDTPSGGTPDAGPVLDDGAAPTEPVPVEPTGALAPPGDLRVVRAASDAITLEWSASTGDADGYAVYRDGTLRARVPGTSFVDPDVAPGRAYAYAVAAVSDDEGQSVRTSAVRSFAGDAALLDTVAPFAPRGVVARTAGDGALVTWAPGADDRDVVGWNVYRDGVYVTTAFVPAWFDAEPNPRDGDGDAPAYRVAAFDRAGNFSVLSPTATAAVPLSAEIAALLNDDVNAYGDERAEKPLTLVNETDRPLVILGGDRLGAIWPVGTGPRAGRVSLDSTTVRLTLLLLGDGTEGRPDVRLGLTVPANTFGAAAPVVRPSASGGVYVTVVP